MKTKQRAGLSLRIIPLSCLLLGACAGLCRTEAESLFNGRDLSGWEGDGRFWKVEDGAITGESGGSNPCKKDTFLILKNRMVGDFELTLQFRFLSNWGNSGIQYRSRVGDAKAFTVDGYQADIETGTTYTGILYEQGGRGVLIERGENATIDPDGRKTVVGRFEEAKTLTLEKGRWHTQKIIAQGSRLIQEIDGIRTMEVIDRDADHSAANGCLALQLHGGPAMKIQFKDIVLRPIP